MSHHGALFVLAGSLFQSHYIPLRSCEQSMVSSFAIPPQHSAPRGEAFVTPTNHAVCRRMFVHFIAQILGYTLGGASAIIGVPVVPDDGTHHSTRHSPRPR